MRGNDCAYLHALDFNDVSSKIEQVSLKSTEPTQSIDTPTEQIFTRITKKKPKTLDLANKIKLKQLQDKYPEKLSSKITDIFWETNFDSEKTLRLVTDQFGTPTKEEPTEKSKPAPTIHTAKSSKAPKSIKWVETGEALGDLNKKYRDEAN
eukprot:TRINITY_DN14096_c0_g1_i1.p1 TRINITY_DN14096_c0_g1~~TRINITY_DN14096_c0_g1_i1.p1  ORF type:complete len:151 (+),score=41.36 TRINITY_DN14096_c0_g1_i1:67-519(+)